jgi:peroxiredoxin
VCSDELTLIWEACDLTRDDLTILSDPEATAIAAVGLSDRDEEVEHVIARPAVFVIDGAGHVRYRYVGRDPEDRPLPALLLLAIESLATPAP